LAASDARFENDPAMAVCSSGAIAFFLLRRSRKSQERESGNTTQTLVLSMDLDRVTISSETIDCETGVSHLK
jgi:hypothetical protein